MTAICPVVFSRCSGHQRNGRLLVRGKLTTLGGGVIGVMATRIDR